MSTIDSLLIQEVCDGYLAGASAHRLAAMYNCSDGAIYYCLLTNGIERRPPRMRQYAVDINYFDSIDNEETAYWLGFLLADGCIQHPSTRSFIIRLTLATRDVGHLKKFAQYTSLENPIRTYQYSANRQFSRITVCSAEWASALRKYGMVSNKSIKGFATPNLSSKLYSPFYRGFFDGDGCISLSNSGDWVAYCLGPKQFIRDFAHWIADNASVSSQRTYQTKWNNTWQWRYGGNCQVPRIMDALYKNATIYLDRKYELYQTMLHELRLEAA